VRTWIEVIGVVSVVVSLGLLTWEINQANSIARYNAYSDIGQQYNEANLLQASSDEFAGIYAVLSEEGRELTQLEIQKTLGLCAWLRNIWNSAWRAHEEGLINHDKYQATLNDIENTIVHWPAIKPYLRSWVQSLTKNTTLTEVELRILELTGDSGQSTS
jgi:hypothetical protein